MYDALAGVPSSPVNPQVPPLNVALLHLALFDPPGYAVAFPDCDIDSADVNGDGNVDSFDIDPFLTCLFGSCP